jgi:hypothetical protein
MAAKTSSSSSVTIRMGAAHWDVTVGGANGGDPLNFDLRSMDRKDRLWI